MKKFVFSLLAILFMPLVVSADTIDVDSADLSLEIPDSWYIFTRDNLDNNPDLEELELTEDYVMDYFLEYSIYVNAFDADYDFYAYMSYTEDVGSLPDYYDFELEEVATDLMNQYGASSYEIYDNDYKYIRIEYTSNDYYIIDYYTIIDDQSYIFSIQKIAELTNEDRDLMEDIVDSIHFDNYVDEDSNELIIVIAGVSIVVVLMLVVFIVSKVKDKKVSQENV